MKFFIFSLMCLLSILALTIILGVMKGFSVFVIIGLVLASVSLIAVFILFLMNRKTLKKQNRGKIENNDENR